MTPTPPAARPRRWALSIDGDEARPAPGRPLAPRPQPPAPTAGRPPVPAAPAGGSEPPSRLRVRRLLSSVRADANQLTVRTGLRREQISWPDIRGFEAYLDDEGEHGYLVAQTLDGLVALPATRRRSAELGDVHAALEAFRMRESA